MDTIRLLTAVGPLSVESALAVKDLVSAVTAQRGVSPISEQPMLWLMEPRVHVAHIMATEDNALVAYGQMDLSNEDEISLEMAVHPDAAGRGLERRLLEAGAYVAQENDASFSLWTHAPSAQSIEILTANGFTPSRTLLRLRRSLSDHAGSARAEGTRHFVENQDEEEWLKANAEAFSWHPEQGKMTRADLEARKREPWFDASTFLLAERATTGESTAGSTAGSTEIAGFSWLKLEPGQETGEIYALGVVPNAQGSGLGMSLLESSLNTLRERGRTAADLYVEADNAAALALYSRFGFTEVERHIKFRQTRP
ncbi:mycothiol synthase [Timonella senegalensis]|uniref:mycothiol synthase n=1 Tax=Timonella senegalensis TaxID=1465825 RepID=UPI0002F41FE0|nr:mycothiol synthase [Timonella senegalensis]